MSESEQLEKDIRDLAEKGIVCKVDFVEGTVLCDRKHCTKDYKHPQIQSKVKETLKVPKADFNRQIVEEYFGV